MTRRLPQKTDAPRLFRSYEEVLDKNEVLACLREAAGKPIETYFSENPGLPQEIRAMLVHLRHVQNPGSERTLTAYSRGLCELFNHLEVSFHEAKPWHLVDHVERLRARGLSRSTQALAVAIMKSFFGHLHAIGLLPLNPAATLKAPRKESKVEEKTLSFEEKDRLLAYAQRHARPRDYIIARLLYGTGIRAEEITGISWGDLSQDLKKRWWVAIRRKGGDTQMVYLPGPLLRDLLAHRSMVWGIAPEARNAIVDEMPVIASLRSRSKPISPNSIYKIVHSLGLAALGKEISPHWFRHTFSTHAREHGAELSDLQTQLGHKNITTTMQYEHSRHRQEHPAGEALEKSGDLDGLPRGDL